MEHVLLYQAIKQKFLECRRAALDGTMTPDEAGDEYTKLAEELGETHGYEIAENAMNEFTSDLRALNWMERIDHFGPVAMIVGFISGYLVAEARIIRIISLNDELLRLDAEYYEPEPGDAS